MFRWVSTWVLTICMGFLLLVVDSDKSSAITAGVVCNSVNDSNPLNAGGTDLASVQFLRTIPSCLSLDGLNVGPSSLASGTFPLVVLLNTNFAAPPVVLTGLRIDYDASVTNLTVDGAPYVSGTTILADTAAPFSHTVQYDFGGNTYNFTTEKDAASNTLKAFTILAGVTDQLRRGRTKRVISNFMSRRADQITANDPDLVNRLNGGNSGGGGGPVSFAANGTLQNNQIAFSTSLRQVMGSSEAAKTKRRAELAQMMSLGQQSIAGTTLDQGLGFDIWVQGTWARVDQDTSESDIGLLYVGADYRISPALLVGVLGQVDWTDEEDKTQNIKADGRGWMIGPYMVARLHQNLLFDGRVAWGQSDNDVSQLGTYTDSFDTDRWLVRGQLTGDFKYDRWHFAPSVRVIYFEEDQKAYRDSLGVFIPGQTISLGRVSFDPKVSTSFTTADGSVLSPHLAIKGIWDFDEAEIVNITTGLAAGSDNDLRARVEAGVVVRYVNGWRLNGAGFVDGIGANDLDIYGGNLTLSVPLN